MWLPAVCDRGYCVAGRLLNSKVKGTARQLLFDCFLCCIRQLVATIKGGREPAILVYQRHHICHHSGIRQVLATIKVGKREPRALANAITAASVNFFSNEY